MRFLRHSTASQSSYGNSKKETSTFIAPRTVVFSLLAFVAVTGWAYVLFGSEAFVVNAVEARGLKNLDQGEVSREVLAILDSRKEWRPWSPRHRWFIDVPKLRAELEHRLFASNVIVDKLDSNVLRLLVEERGNRAVFYSGQQYFWIDLQGVVTEELSLAEKKSAQARILGQRPPAFDDPPLIHRDLPEPIAAGFQIAKSEDVRETIKLANVLQRYEIDYREIQWPETPTSSIQTIIGPEGYPIMMDKTVDVRVQLDAYQAFKRAQGKTQVSEYVDVRIPGRVYVK